MMDYKQIGYNDRYPVIVSVWSLGDKIPEWLSDNAKIKFIDGEGLKTLDIRYKGDGYDIMNTDGINILCSAKTKDSKVCFGGGKFFSMTTEQFRYVYGN
jgi:hypothetical protein